MLLLQLFKWCVNPILFIGVFIVNITVHFVHKVSLSI